MDKHTTDKEHMTGNTQSFKKNSSCEVCKLFTGETLGIGKSQVFKATPCTKHKGLLSWIQTSFEEEIDRLETQYTTRPGDIQPHILAFYGRPGRVPTISCWDYRGLKSYKRKLLLSTSKDKERLDPKWIDLQIARKWMELCNENHGSKCRDPFKAPPCYPAYLIDTVRNCIIQPGKIQLEYVALSYMWGERNGFRTSRSSVESMKDGDGLAPYFNNIPTTIHHAMHIVRSMGERYLWVDSICLISDNTEHLAEQLQLMGLIYARAKLTIVATDGDAWDGIDGIRGSPGTPENPRNLSNVFRWTDGTQITVRDQPSLSRAYGSASKYFQRGWTYQEYYLSQRRLILRKKQIYWNCTCAFWHEDDPGSLQDDPDGLQDPDELTMEYFQIPNILSGKPDFKELGRLALEYHSRDFTCPDDAVPGLNGLLTLLSRTFEGGFLCGHPEAWFDAALMWHFISDYPIGYHRETFLEPRRVAKNPSILPEAVLPSWSWIGWKGNQLGLLQDEEDFELPQWLNHHDSGWLFVTTPITTWYSHETPHSDKRRIRSFPQQTPEVDRSLEDCYQGWVAEEYDPTRQQFAGRNARELVGKRVYHHPSLPNRYFWRPFPKPGVDQCPSVCIPKQYQYISCRTKRGWFHVNLFSDHREPSQWDADSPDLRDYAQAVIIDDLRQPCGRLQVPPGDDLLSTNRHTYGGLGGGEDKPASVSKVELVAVCLRRVSCSCWPSATCKVSSQGPRDFYGVLWIEWKSGVAYRRGCGYVIKEMWDAHELEDVDLILG